MTEECCERSDLAHARRSVGATRRARLGWQGAPAALSVAQLEVLTLLMDALVPPSGPFPPPSSVRVVEEFVAPCLGDESVRAPGLLPTAELLDRIDRITSDRPSNVEEATRLLARIEAADEPLFRALLVLTYHGYYSRAAVVEELRRTIPAAEDFQPTPQPRGYRYDGDWADLLARRARRADATTSGSEAASGEAPSG